ncbi:MAG: hypothetical protein COV67_10105 [Nitrospinae bacterium CG11_big_fil_rev_8_21_14_0_20_56_8]|nr:MAG: hypothetical protein COV67_10105 [Nitrospinae bacterium CG11_big_fil_rev_8_21_14_0_20_56_8]
MDGNARDHTRIWLAAFAGLVLTCVLAYYARRVLTPFLVALALAYLLDPVVDLLERWKLSRTVAVLLLMLVFFLLSLGMVLILFPLLRIQAEKFIHDLPQYITVIQGWIQPIVDRIAGMDQEKIREVLNQALERLGQLPLRLLSASTSFLWDSLSGLLNIVLFLFSLFIIPVATFYLLRDFDLIWERVMKLVPPRFRDQVMETVREIESTLAKFVRGQLMVAVTLGGLYSIGLFLCGTPMGLFIGILAGFASMIPYLGLVVGFVPAALMTYIQYQDWLLVGGVALVFAVVQALEGMVLTPRIVGDTLGLHPVVILLAVLLGAEFFGFMGVLLAVPMVAVLNVLVRRGLELYRGSDFFSSP